MMMRNTSDDRNDYDKPPHSRLFIVCRQHTKEVLLPLFEKYGQVDDMYMPKDRNTGILKGIAFVKYNKTSSAAAAIQELHMKCIEKDNKPLKVMVASNKTEGPFTNEEKFKRLFIKVQKSITENEIREHFSRFGEVASVHLQKDKTGTDQCRGFAYVNYTTFLDAAKAYEQCDNKYRPIFATPKDELKRPRISDEIDNYQNNYLNGMTSWRDDSFDYRSYPKNDFDKRDAITSMITTKPRSFDTINVTCSPAVPQRCIEQLFNIIPGVVNFRFVTEFNENKAIIKYDTEVGAAHAIEVLNCYQFPSGEVITVKPVDSPLSQAANNLSEIVNSFKNAKDSSRDMLQLAEAIAQASNLIKAATSKESHPESSNDFEYICGVKVPLTKPLASKSSKLAKRCFIVLKPLPPPHHVLQNIFCRFGDLIDVAVFPNKTFGFAKYASARAAEEAMRTLHEATLYGIKFKVVEADDKPSKEDKMNVDDDEGSADHDMETKRARIVD
ncbi:RNA-binding protein 45 [Operophtera brumata]|uniref:RNA-binding protein 45 n=1 Tax=Operophtera brumata TaxID=104452 RepID=A0A0L7L239_OPEBR|nr:RNA-binding protein 45 [Operophtera brumata]